jgi:hypothetical protein
VTKTNLRFSIIIPLEFHRGQVEACLQLWGREQTYPRNQYEIIAVGCQHSLDEATIAFFKSLMGEHDRFLLFNEPHDMALCAYGAQQAKGEVLFFTESHCLPEPNILSVIDNSLNIHPEWAGFSCQSIRITPNRLSVIEADMYEADILYGMKEHPWRKILDQCFAIRSESYHHAGGFRPELGHFAEWHLAAQMHQKEYQIGYVPAAQVHHYYIGDINELIEFTKDFAHGELVYHSTFINDECRSYFIEPLEWLVFYQWDPRLVNVALKLARNIYSTSLKKLLSPREVFTRLRLLFELSFPSTIQMKLAFIKAYFRFQFKRWVLTLLIYLNTEKSLLRAIFIQLIDATIRLERIRFIQNLTKEQTTKDIISSIQSASSLIWMPDTAHPYPSFGFHASEEWQGQKFKWSEPVALIKIPLMPGTYQLKIEWLPLRNIEDLRLYINEKQIAGFHEGTTLRISFQVTSDSSTNFALTCEPWAAPNDKRLLGLPIASISVTPQ